MHTVKLISNMQTKILENKVKRENGYYGHKNWGDTPS